MCWPVHSYFMGLLDTAIRGVAAGILATIPMTAVMVLGQRATRYGRLPPEALVKNAEALASRDANGDETRDSGSGVRWRAAHLLAGAAFGVLYAVVFRHLATAIPAPMRGLVFGLSVWFVSYQGVAPALNLLPPATDDVRARQATNVIAHAVFGGVLGLLSGSAGKVNAPEPA